MISFLARPMARFAVLGAIILSRVLGLTPGVGRTTTQGQCECHLPTSASAHLWTCRTTQAQIDPRKYPVCEDNARGLPWPPECRHNRGCHLRSLEAAHPLGVQAQTLLQAQGAGLPVGLRAVHGARETCPSAHGGVQAADLWAARHCLGLPPLQRLLQPSPQGLSPQPRLLQPSPQARGGHESVGGRNHTSKQGTLRRKVYACRRADALQPPPRLAPVAPHHTQSQSPTQSYHSHLELAASTACAIGHAADHHKEGGRQSSRRGLPPWFPPQCSPLPWDATPMRGHYRGSVHGCHPNATNGA